MKLRRPVGSSDLHRPDCWHQILKFGRSVWHQKTTRGAPMISPRYCNTLPRGYLEVLGQFWGEPRSSIHSSISVSPGASPKAPKSRTIGLVNVLEPSEGGQGSFPDAWAGVEPGLVGPPDKLAHALLYIFIIGRHDLNANAPSSLEGRRIRIIIIIILLILALVLMQITTIKKTQA